MVAGVSGEDHLNDRTVIVGWMSRAEGRQTLQNTLQVDAKGSGVEPLLAERIAFRIFCFRNAVADQNDSGAWSKSSDADGVLGADEEAYGEIRLVKSRDAGVRADSGIYVSTVDVLQSAVPIEPQQHHGGIFSDGLLTQIPVRCRGNRIKRLAGFQLNVQHALQGRGENGGRNSLTRNVDQRNVQRIFTGDYI